MIGADRYRNLDDDLPKDFESRRTAYYNALNLTSDARAFTRKIQAELERELRLLNAELPRNDKVRILWRGENRISITPFQPLPEPQGLRSVKAEIGRRWPMTELLEVLKETALDTGFLDAFETSASRVALSRGALDRRLILCLYGLGTNAGLKRVAAGCPDVSYEELLHVGRRFIHRDALGAACGRQCDAGNPQRRHLGRSRHGLCLGFQEIRRLGRQPYDRMACPLWSLARNENELPPPHVLRLRNVG